MLIELWEKFRGYDEWIQVEAKLDQAVFERTIRRHKGQRYDAYSSSACVNWVDQQGRSWRARFNVPVDSLLKMSGREEILIRYNPSNPNDCYFPELVRSQVHSAMRMARNLALSGVGVWLIVLLLNWLFPQK